MYPRRSPRLIAAVAAALMGAAIVAACAGTGADPQQVLPSRAGAAELSRVYRLGVGDKVKVTVFGEADLSGTYEVNAAGNVPVALVGEIPARGHGIDNFREQVRRKLQQGYLNNPKVSVEVVNFRPIYIHGEVRSGGEFPFKNGLKLRDAIALAGGYTYRANESQVILVREGSGAQVALAMPADIDVLPGDNIRIPERFF